MIMRMNSNDDDKDKQTLKLDQIKECHNNTSFGYIMKLKKNPNFKFFFQIF